MRKVVRLVWNGISTANTLWWLYTLGGGLVIAGVGGIVLTAVGVSLPFAVLAGIGLFLLATAGVLASRGRSLEARQGQAMAEGTQKPKEPEKKSKQTVRGDKNISLQNVRAGRDVIAAETLVQIENLTTIPDPKIEWAETVKNAPGSSLPPMFAERHPNYADLFVTQIALDLQAQYVPPKLRAEVTCESLDFLQLLPRDRVGTMTGFRSSSSAGHGYVQIESPSNGGYSLNIYTRESEANPIIRFLTTN